ncbi:hypothetical protein [Streptomyces sp. CAU 1734]|uniref:hypothetical protein n=1 Tax=Streptomyces sp. CAU 1734 TaxID=3140360 RepID=UPI0032611A4C
MGLYKVSRTDRHDYDEYDAIVVRAASGDEALSIATSRDREEWDFSRQFEEPTFRGFRLDGSNLTVEPVDADGAPGLILGSFNAG